MLANLPYKAWLDGLEEERLESRKKVYRFNNTPPENEEEQAALIRQTAADFLNGGLDEKYSIEVQIDRSAQSLTLEADQFLLLRALANLVNNCIRHNPDGCAITLGVRSRGKECVLWVRNQIASGEDPRPQFRRQRLQLPPLRQERGGLLPDGTAGHGTGLKLVEQIARAHNGRAVLRGGEGYFCCEVWLPL